MQTAEQLGRALHEYLAASQDAVVLENGETIFDFRIARYSLAVEQNKCVLHLWSPERNYVRRVLEAEEKSGVLRVAVQRFGQPRPGKLEICRNRDRRTATTQKAQRSVYQSLLRRVIERTFLDCKLKQLKTSVDLERSFGPIYARGVLRKGQTQWAVLGVNAQETQASIDAALTFGVLWLDCLRQAADNVYFAGLKLFLPQGTSAVVRERIAHLNRDVADWQLFELHERDESIAAIDTADRGNVATQLVQCPNESAARERFAPSIARIKDVVPECEVSVISPAEISFRLRGVEFARARIAFQQDTFRSGQEIVFGVGAAETVLNESSHAFFSHLLSHLRQSRRPELQAAANPLWRMVPERWLESLVTKQVDELDHRLDPQFVYSQVPAFSASDRAMIDVLTRTHDGRLALLELKADEDIHLPMQGLDYWARVRWHQLRGQFQSHGYFPGIPLSDAVPLLLLVAPALRIHPQTDTLLRYFSPEIPWELLAIDEHWRRELRVVFRKSSASKHR